MNLELVEKLAKTSLHNVQHVNKYEVVPGLLLSAYSEIENSEFIRESYMGKLKTNYANAIKVFKY